MLRIKNTFIQSILMMAVIVTAFIVPLATFAQTETDTGTEGTGEAISTDIKVGNPLSDDRDFETIVTSVLEKLIQFGTLLLAVMIVWTGFLFVSSGGAPDKLSTAKKSLIATLIGGAIILGAYGISELVVDTVGGL